MLGFAMAALVGAGLVLGQSMLLAVWGLLIGAGLSLGSALLLHWRARQTPGAACASPIRLQLARVMAWIGVAALFSAWTVHLSEGRLSTRLAQADDGGLHLVEIELEGLPQRMVTAYGQPAWRFEARLLSGPRPGASGRFSWVESQGRPIPAKLSAGDRWRLVMRLRNASGTRNPYGFDAETWLFAQGRLLAGSVATTGQQPRPIALDQSMGLMARVDRLRQRVRDDIEQALAGQAHWGVLSGLTVGDQQSIDRESWSVFSQTGVSHLISISGMHVTMFAALARWLVGLLWRMGSRPPLRLALYVPRPVAAAVAASLAATGYALLAGFNIPAQRTALMVSVAALASLTGLRASPWGIIGLTLFLVLVFDPFAPLAPGFWLSFVAVAILFGQGETPQTPLRGLHEAIRAQWAITLGLAPLTACLFQQISLVGPIANAIAIPVVTFLVTPLAMLGAVGLAIGLDAPLAWGRQVFEWLYWFLEWAANRSWASLDWHGPPLWASVMAGAGSLIALQSSLPRWRHLGWLACLLLLLGRPPMPKPGTFEAVFWDVGQGSAILIRTASHSLLIDTGPSMGEATAAERILAPQLWGVGLSRLSGLLISHADDDHASGIREIVGGFQPNWLISSMKVGELKTLGFDPSTDRSTRLVACELGLGWVWDGVHFRALAPVAQTEGRTGNEESCVLEVTDARGNRLILPGDISAGTERSLIEQMPWLQTGQPTVLALAHHGSKTSSDDVFLRALRPQAVITQSAYRGRFQHPHPEVLERLTAMDIPIYRVDLLGALRLRFNAAQQAELHLWAQEGQRFWHLPRIPY